MTTKMQKAEPQDIEYTLLMSEDGKDAYSPLVLAKWRGDSVWWLPFIYIFQILFFLSSLSILFYSLHEIQNQQALAHAPNNNELEAFRRVTTNITWPRDNIYMRPPAEERDHAWQQLYRGWFTVITADDIRALGKDPAKYVRYKEEDGGGYMGMMEVTHHLHCLDILRKVIQNGDAHGDDTTLDLLNTHTNHCIDNLREVLLCQADPTMRPFVWRQGFGYPAPDTVVSRECRNWEAVQAWGETKKAPADWIAGLQPRKIDYIWENAP